MNRSFAAIALGAVLSLPAAGYDVAGMRDAMRSVFSAMRVLLELSASPAELADPGNERAVLGAAAELADQAAIVSEHAPRDEVSFLAGSLDRYAAWIRRSYEWGRHDATARLVRDAVDVCIACHTRLPSRNDSPLAEDFLAREAIASLPDAQRARLQIATRRFEDALDTLEAVLRRAGDDGTFEQALRDYLVVAVRVKGHPGRAQRFLRTLAQGSGEARRERLDLLAGALQRLEIAPPASGDRDAARELVREAEARLGAGRGLDLVDYVAASRLLHEFLQRGTGTVEQGAEAYYLLGLAQYRIERDAWLPQAELYLEKAIRTAPATPHARRALALLRTKVAESFAAPDGTLPEDVVEHLRMLQEMVEGG